MALTAPCINKILICCKPVIDLSFTPKIDNGAINKNELMMSPYDEVAIECANQLQRFLKKDFRSVTLASVVLGKKQTQQQNDVKTQILRKGIALLGANQNTQAVLIHGSAKPTPLNTAKAIQMLHKKERYDLILTGEKASSENVSTFGYTLSGVLQIPFVEKAKHIIPKANKISLLCSNNLKCTSSIPAIVSCDFTMNTPKVVTLPNLLKARRKKIQEIEYRENDREDKMHDNFISRYEYIPTQEKKTKIFNSATELLHYLKNAKLL